MCSAFAIRATLRLSKENQQGACDDALVLARIARLYGQTPTLISYLHALGIDAIAMATTRSMLASNKLDSRSIRKFEEAYRSLPRLGSLKDALDLGERMTFLEYVFIVDRAASQRKRFNYTFQLQLAEDHPVLELLDDHFDLNRALTQANAIADQWVGIVQIQNDDPNDERVAAWEKNRDAELTQFNDKMLQNMMALKNEQLPDEQRTRMVTDFWMRWLACMASSYSPSTGRTRNRLDGHRIVTHAAFAVAAFRADHGQYPDSLQELVPRYLDQMPMDLFADGPLRFHRNGDGCLIYSVGENGIDEDGVKCADQNDLVIYLP